jgi:hypothetical protein
VSKILNVAGHPVDLDDGRVLAPGEEAEADTNHPHNRMLVVRGLVNVTEGTTPRKTQPARLVKNAADSTDTGEDDNR